MNQKHETRLECLRLACQSQPQGSLFNADTAIERADQYYNWVTATTEPDDQTPRTSRKAPAHARKSGR